MWSCMNDVKSLVGCCLLSAVHDACKMLHAVS